MVYSNFPSKAEASRQNDHFLRRVLWEAYSNRPHWVWQNPHPSYGRFVCRRDRARHRTSPLINHQSDGKTRVALQVEGSVETHHIDEIPTDLLQELIIPRMHEIGYDSTSTMFLFISPQKLATTPSLLTALFVCHQLQTLRLVVIDKAHLYAQHGRSFRESLRILTTILFDVIFRVGH